MFSSSDLHAKDSQSQESVLDWMTRVLTWRSTPLELFATLLRPGSALRTSLACFPVGPVLRNVRQEWKLDVVSRAESFENFARVISNRCGVDPVRLEFFKRELQLDELVAAVGSPIGAAAEDQQQPI